MTDATLKELEEKSHKRLTGYAGIDSAIRGPIPSIRRNRFDAKKHAERT